jgi:NADP-dependent 3-hydroxy acid dehydrogenase YdfG
MTDHIAGKSIIVTGAAGGFGRRVSEKAAARGARVTCADVQQEALEEAVAAIRATGGDARAVRADVTDMGEMRALARAAVDAFGGIDVMINNAGVMPLAFHADHETALEASHRCIDVNFKGVVNGIAAVHDQMLAQGRGHVINLSSIYGNAPVAGAGVYGATKAAVNFLSESLRVESRGKIKVTTVRPTGVPGTGLGAGIVNPDAIVGILAQNAAEFGALVARLEAGDVPADLFDAEQIGYAMLDPDYIAEQLIHVIDQPWGVSLGDITIRAAGDHYVL